MAKTISLLDKCRIASPCDVGWVNMRGDDKVRHCDRCQLNVYNLSGMTRREAEDLIRSKEGRLCVSIYRRLDGTVLTADCPIGLRRARMALARMFGVGTSIVGACLAIAATMGISSHVRVRLRELEPFSRVARWITPLPTPLPPGARSDGAAMAP